MANKHTAHHIHAMRIILLGMLLIAVSIVRIDAHALPRMTKPSVLAYATSMSRSDLFAAANSSRAANGLAPFTLNGQLNNSAQAKAQHMADNNYWAHVAPDGTQPWYFSKRPVITMSEPVRTLHMDFLQAMQQMMAG